MPNGRVYGKRTNRIQHVASQFFDSSSPAKLLLMPDLKHPKELASGTVDENIVEPEVQAVEPRNDGSESVDEIAERLRSLELGKLKSTTNDSNEGIIYNIEKRVLEVKDVNTVARPQPRRKYKARDDVGKIPETAKEQVIESETSDERKVLVDLPCVLTHSVPVPEKRTVAGNQPFSCKNSPQPSAKHRTRRNQQKVSPTPPATPYLVEYTKPLLSLCSDITAQSEPKPFQEWADSLSRHFKISKIAEASYGEVYRLSLRDYSSGFTRADESVLKIIALKPPPSPPPTAASANVTKESSLMSAVADVAFEIRLLQLMSPVPGWTRFRDISVLRGRIPRQFVDAWKQYNKQVRKSLFPDPGRKASYNEDQLWAVVEMQDAGTDLETLIERGEGVVGRVEAVWDVFWGVACTVAKGEEWADFEHRDLHLGNICIRAVQRNACQDERRNTPGTNPQAGKRKLGITNLETTVIDYTLSRASLHNHGADREDRAVFFDLAKDPAIFQGDGADDYQYDIYRYMRSAVLCGDPAADGQSVERTKNKKHRQRGKKDGGTKETAENMGNVTIAQVEVVEYNATGSVWRQYHPLTNLVWLHFVLHTLLKHVESAPPPIQQTENNSTGTPRQSPFSLLAPPLTPSETTSLHERLTLLDEKLSIRQLKTSGFCSAADLVDWAVREGWLDEEDVIGCSDRDSTEVVKGGASFDILVGVVG